VGRADPTPASEHGEREAQKQHTHQSSHDHRGQSGHIKRQPAKQVAGETRGQAGHATRQRKRRKLPRPAGALRQEPPKIGGQEQLANGVNPAYNRERFVEAHDLIQKTWTQPGPFRWEGTHYQHRVVNPWAVPLQKPYPRVWIPGVLSRETVIWTAQQRYPYIALNTAIDATKVIWDTYSKAAADVGYTAGPENFGYLIRVHVQDTEEKALQNARQFMWMQGEFTGLAHPVWANPSGYFSPSGRRGFVEFAVGRAKNPRGQPTFEEQVADTMIIAGTPDQVIARLKHLIEHTRPGIMGMWGNDGTVSRDDRRRCIELLVKEVMPAVREHGKSLGLKDPWEANAPVHLKYSTDIPVQKAAAE